MTSVGWAVFCGCTSLTDVYCYAKTVPNTENAFYNTSMKNATLYVPESSIEAYKSTSPWSEFGNIVALPDEPTSGDANGDNTVNAADIVEVVNAIMGNPSEGFDESAADVNGDGVVNAADIVAIVNIIMKAE